ncbi:MAG: hypothetical protein DBX90_07695 [Lentisphaerae bacterium]|nr:MAG: hypothetical protein DBX90_07695 [Lentisphaerota bacterium]
MFCPKCGKELPAGTAVCPSCGGNAGSIQPVKINSGLIGAIIVTVCCCLPFGIVAIVYAAKVPGLAAAGQFVEAQEAASKSKMWSWIGFGIGLVVILLNIILQVAAS